MTNEYKKYSHKFYSSFQSSINSHLLKNIYNSLIELSEKKNIQTIINVNEIYPHNEHKISRMNFLRVFQKYFPYHKELYNSYFNRFKNYKLNFENLQKNYFINNYYSLEEIDVYSLIISLILFSKMNYKEKLKNIFIYSDYDNDNLLNEREILKIIYNINYLFPFEKNKMNFNIILNRNLSFLISKKYYETLIYKFNLYEYFRKEKLIEFEKFYEIFKNKDFIPVYIDLKNEIENHLNKPCEDIKIKESNLDNFLNICNDLIINERVEENKITHSNLKKFFNITPKKKFKLLNPIQEFKQKQNLLLKKLTINKNRSAFFINKKLNNFDDLNLSKIKSFKQSETNKSSKSIKNAFLDNFSSFEYAPCRILKISNSQKTNLKINKKIEPITIKEIYNDINNILNKNDKGNDQEMKLLKDKIFKEKFKFNDILKKSNENVHINFFKYNVND